MSNNEWIPIERTVINELKRYEVTYNNGIVCVHSGCNIRNASGVIAVREYNPTPYVAPTPIDHSALWRGCVGAWCPSVNTKIEPGWRLLKKSEKPALGDWLSLDGVSWLELEAGFIPRQGSGLIYRRRIEPAYRPFANAAEFMPHRERWVIEGQRICKPQVYSDSYIEVNTTNYEWDLAFRLLAFEDGSPFGVEVTK
jgi:hypothetical protein